MGVVKKGMIEKFKIGMKSNFVRVRIRIYFENPVEKTAYNSKCADY